MPTGSPRPPRRAARRGFTYLWLLFVLALGGVALAAVGELEQDRQLREREAELRFRGEAIALALGRYAEQTPLGQPPLPRRLEDLLADTRFPKPRRHLRQVYTDPFTGRPDWELMFGQVPMTTGPDARLVQATGIVGVRSRLNKALRAYAQQYKTAHDWVFTATLSSPSNQGQ